MSKNTDDTPGQVPKSWGKERRGWHIEKAISYSDILHMAATVVAIASVMIMTDRRIEKNAADIKRVTAVQAENDLRQDQLRDLFVKQLSEIRSDVKWLVRRENDSAD